MNEYIDKKQAIDRIASCYCMDCEHSNGILCRACEHQDDMDLIDDMPAVDVQPVKRGKWCPPLMGQGKFATYCSMCQYTVMRNAAGIFEETPFCPHCGADMRGE